MTEPTSVYQKTLRFSPIMDQYVAASRRSWLNIAEGGKRSGKNVTNIVAFGLQVLAHPDKIHFAAGVTLAAAKMNIVDSNGLGLMNMLEGYCEVGRYQGKEALLINGPGGEKIIVLSGGSMSSDAARIKGMSFGSIYISEANECNETFVREAIDRTLSSRRRRVFMDINPKSPGHWFYKRILDPLQGKPGVNWKHFTLYDNPGIPRERIEELLSTYDKQDVWYRRDIMGERVSAAGAIYRFSQDEVISRDEANNTLYDKFAIGIDVGGTDATVASLIGITSDKKRVVVIDGIYHKQGKGVGMTDASYAKLIAGAIESWVSLFPKLFNGYIFVDSADKLFRTALANALRSRGLNLQVASSYKHSILRRISLVCMLMTEKRFAISAHLSQWREAYGNAVWSEKGFLSGEWERVDDGSYPVDCLDSVEYAIEPFARELIGGSRPRAVEY